MGGAGSTLTRVLTHVHTHAHVHTHEGRRVKTQGEAAERGLRGSTPPAPASPLPASTAGNRISVVWGGGGGFVISVVQVAGDFVLTALPSPCARLSPSFPQRTKLEFCFCVLERDPVKESPGKESPGRGREAGPGGLLVCPRSPAARPGVEGACPTALQSCVRRPAATGPRDPQGEATGQLPSHGGHGTAVTWQLLPGRKGTAAGWSRGPVPCCMFKASRLGRGSHSS